MSSRESVRLWKSSIPGVELFSAQLVDHRFDKHFHDTYTIGLNDGGLGSFLRCGERHIAYPGSLNLVSPGEVHTGQVDSDAGWQFRNFYISVSCVEQALAQLDWPDCLPPVFSASVINNPALRATLDRLFQALATTSQLTQESLLLESVAQLLTCTQSSICHVARRSLPLEPQAISTIRSYLETHYAESISVETLSRLVNLSPYYLIRSFRQQVGIPPHGYQRQWQLLQAKRSLQTSKSLTDIALEHGFYDQSHLNRSFKRAFGITPGQYQKSYHRAN